jgi:DNA invertase Pin-like site-specific DNA recombinase
MIGRCGQKNTNKKTRISLFPARFFQSVADLARALSLQDIVRAVRAKGASLKATEQPIDTSTAGGKCFLDMLGVFAEFETNVRR